MARKDKYQNARGPEYAAMRRIEREARKLMVSEKALIKAYKFLVAAGMPTTRKNLAKLAYQYDDKGPEIDLG